MNDISQMLGGQTPAGLGDLISKFEAGQHDQVSDANVQATYGQVAGQLPPDQYVAAAKAAFDRLTPEQRAQFAKELQAKAQQFGLPGLTGAVPTDPAGLAAAAGEVHAQGPNLLPDMFAPGGVLSSPAAKAVLLGVATMAAQRLMGRR
jgi:hypothetical protein